MIRTRAPILRYTGYTRLRRSFVMIKTRHIARRVNVFHSRAAASHPHVCDIYGTAVVKGLTDLLIQLKTLKEQQQQRW